MKLDVWMIKLLKYFTIAMFDCSKQASLGLQTAHRSYQRFDRCSAITAR